MADGFTESEREYYREQLLVEGRELFARYGLQKTTIADLTDAVGIASGTFYQFYDSKTDLYTTVLGEEIERLYPDLLRPLEVEDDPEEALVGFLTAVMDEIETNPLIQTLLVDSEEMEMLREYHDEDEKKAEREQSLAYFLPYVQAWYEAGEVDGPNAKTVANAVRAVTFLTLHQEDIGEDLYDETRDLVIRAVAKGLTATGE
jgi:AcrR family transcriptional regulator